MPKNLNDKKYRECKDIVSCLDKKQDFSSSTILSPKNMFFKPMIVSFYSTGSDSVVYKIVSRKFKRCIILKISPHILSSLHEIYMYELVNNMVNLNITPCVIKHYDLKNYTLLQKNVHESIRSHIHYKRNIVISTETYNSNIKSLQKSSLKQPLSVFFQMIYTLSCFQKMGFYHNDLHHSNIFIVSLKGRKDYYNKFICKLNNKTKTFYIPTRGEHVRIFDFDRSMCQPKNKVKNILKVPKSYVYETKKMLYNNFGEMYTYYDEKRDLCRFLFPFLRTRTKKQERNIALQLFNLNQKSQTRSVFPTEVLDICDKKLLKYDYFVDSSEKPLLLPESILPTIDQMLDSDVFDMFTVLPKNGKINTTYSMSHIFV